MNKKMDRLYIKIIGGYTELKKTESVTIYHRPTHSMLFSCSPKKLLSELKRLESMSVKDFILECRNRGLKMSTEALDVNSNINDKAYAEKEHWYEGAWSYGTEYVYRKHKLKHTQDDPQEFSDEWRRQERADKKNGWDIDGGGTPKKRRKKRRDSKSSHNSKIETAVARDNTPSRKSKRIRKHNSK